MEHLHHRLGQHGLHLGASQRRTIRHHGLRQPGPLHLGCPHGKRYLHVSAAGLTPNELAGGITFEKAELTFVCRKLYQGQVQREGLADEIRHGIYENWDPHWMFVGEILEVEDKR